MGRIYRIKFFYKIIIPRSYAVGNKMCRKQK